MFIHDLFLLVAIAVPVLAVAGINLFLYLGGERGTLLMPSVSATECPVEEPDGRVDVTPRATGRIAEAANEGHEIDAA